LRAWIEVGGALFTLIGVVIGVYGTFLMTKFYHPYSFSGFIKSLVNMLGRAITGQQRRNELHVDIAAEFGKLNQEKKGETLSGANWLFVGFFFQTVGAVLAFIDFLMVNFGSHPS
jgi:hypothetical protein